MASFNLVLIDSNYCVAKTDGRQIIIIAATTSVLAVALILLVVVGAILYKNRRYKQYLQLEFKQSEYSACHHCSPTLFLCLES